MTKKPSFQFYPGDWMKDPKLSMCLPITRGIWIDLLCAMHENGMDGEVTATVPQLARICRCLPEEMSTALNDLNVTKTANVTFGNEIVTVICRRVSRSTGSCWVLRTWRLPYLMKPVMWLTGIRCWSGCTACLAMRCWGASSSCAVPPRVMREHCRRA